MAKKIKPDLKGYLKTGKRSVAVEPERAPAENHAFLSLLAPPDLEMWGAMLGAGIGVRLRRLDAASMREDFLSMDRARFTCYTLMKQGERLSPVRSASQIQDSLLFLFKWDENGELTLYSHDAPEL